MGFWFSAVFALFAAVHYKNEQGLLQGTRRPKRTALLKSTRRRRRRAWRDGSGKALTARTHTLAPEHRNVIYRWCFSDYNEEISNRLIYDEERKYGKIPTRIYLLYLKSCGLCVIVVFCLSAMAWQAMKIYTDVWLRDWTSDIDHVQRLTDVRTIYLLFSSPFARFLLAFRASVRSAASSHHLRLHEERPLCTFGPQFRPAYAELLRMGPIRLQQPFFTAQFTILSPPLFYPCR